MNAYIYQEAILVFDMSYLFAIRVVVNFVQPQVKGFRPYWITRNYVVVRVQRLFIPMHVVHPPMLAQMGNVPIDTLMLCSYS